MASSIIASTIDDTYPVAGQDNDSQGFRDNFNIIKTNFVEAKSNIEDLQDKVVLKAPLLGESSVSNNFNGEIISNAAFNEVTTTTANAKATVIEVENPDPVEWDAGAYRIITATGDTTTVGASNINYTFKGWPTDEGRYTEMVFQVYGDGSGATGMTLTFNPQYGSGIASTKFTDGNAAFTGTAITVPTDTTTSVLVKAFTYNGGQSVFLQYLGSYAAV
jgi:hypothetical protein